MTTQISLNRQTRVGLDETTLESIASTTGVEYFYAADAAQLEQVYAHLGSQIQWVQEQTQVTFVASAIGAALLTIAGGLAAFWFGRLPEWQPSEPIHRLRTRLPAPVVPWFGRG